MKWQSLLPAFWATPEPINYSGALEPASPKFGPIASLDTRGECPIDTPISCSVAENSCCLEGTDGIFLLTQFWDYAPATGPNDTWTIHGLWNDRCGGGFRQFCNPSWRITDPVSILQELGLNDTLATIEKYWLNGFGSDVALWQHEFNKHGTCMSTLNPACYNEEAEHWQYVGDFYNTVVRLWEALPSFDFLKEEGIYPSTVRRYDVADFEAAISKHFGGHQVRLGCDRSNSITELWYFFDLHGSVASGEFIPRDSITGHSCRDGMRWLPKEDSYPDRPGKNKVYRSPIWVKDSKGCLNEQGDWIKANQGCTTFEFEETVGGITVTSSLGKCGVLDGRFQCGSEFVDGDFTMDARNGLGYGGDFLWHSRSHPTAKKPVHVSQGNGRISYKLVVPKRR